MIGRARRFLVGVVLIAGVGVPAGSAQERESLFDRPARLQIVDAGLEEALRALQRSSGVLLAFSPDLLPAGRSVSCACAGSTVRVALDRLLAGTSLTYRLGRRQILIGRPQASPATAPVRLFGLVVDAESGRPISSAEVRVVGASTLTVTGDDGRFGVSVTGSGPHELTVIMLGYETRSVRVVDTGSAIRVELTRQPIRLAEIVISPGRFGVLEVSPTVSGSTVSREDIEAIPQFGDDVFRTLKRMPGVTADDISTKLNVRGGTDRDLLVRLDGLELFEPYHLKDLDGALGIIDVQSLGGVDLVTGGFPAEYGDNTAGVFEMYSRRPPSGGTRTTVGMSLSSVSAISQGSLDGGRGQWLMSLRRGFLEYVLAVSGVDDELKPAYWDALGRVQYLVDDNHLLWGEFLYAGDDLDWRDEATGSSVLSSWANGYAWAGWKATLFEGVRMETLLSVGRLTRDRDGAVTNPSDGAFTPLTAEVADVASFDFAGVKQDWEIDVGSDLVLKTGVDARTTRGSYDYLASSSRFDLTEANQLFVRSDTTAVTLDPEGAELGSYVALRGRAGGSLTWEAGARHDWHEHTGDDDLAPRLLLRYDLGDRTSVKGSWGRYFQSQGLHELNAQDGERIFAASEMAEQVAIGVERSFTSGFSVRLEGYHRTVEDPHPVYVNLSREVNPVMEVEADRRRLDPTESRAKGLELILAHDGTGPGSWSASYALASAEDLVDRAWAPRTLDQRHTVNLRGSYRIGRRWQLSGSWSFHSGWPFTEQFLDVEIGLSGDRTEEVNILRREFGELNASRLPAYHRLDVRVTRNFEFRRSRLEVFLDVFNAYNRSNLRGFEWQLEETSTGSLSARRSAGEEQLPILPTLGFRWVF